MTNHTRQQMKKLIEFKDRLELSQRIDGTIFIHTNIKDTDSPEWQETVNHLDNMKIGQEWPPEIIDVIERMEDYDIEVIGEYLHEIAGSQIHVYNHDLARWAFDNHDIIDELLSEYELEPIRGIHNIYKLAMYEYHYSIAQYLYDNFIANEE